jgi:leucine dehydrogenase
MRAVAARRGHASLDGLRVAVQGVGNVGRHILALLHAEGARLLVDDLDPDRVREAVSRFGAAPADGEDVLVADVDLVCPAGAGLVLDADRVEALRAWAVVPAANNALAADELAARLRERGIDYVPDFVANAGGLISCEAEIRGVAEFADRLEAIGRTTVEVLTTADTDGVDSLAAATAVGNRRLAGARARRATLPTPS